MKNIRPVQFEPKSMSLGKKVVIAAVTIVVGLSGLGVAVVIYLAVSATSYCNKKSDAIEKQGSELQQQLGAIKLNGQGPSNSEHHGDGDCLTGSGGTAISTFNTAFDSLSAANDAVNNAIDMSTASDVSYATFDNHPEDSLQDGININFSKAGIRYRVSYTFATPAVCDDSCNSSIRRQQISTSLAGQPVSKIEIEASGSVNT